MSTTMGAAAPTRPGQNRGYVLALLTLVYAFNFVDRQILSILAPSIAADLGFEDTGIGLLTGFWFALFYTALGLPIALLADRTNRKAVVAVALAVWSGFTFLSGFVTSFFWLAAARIGVAIGEAGGSPPSHSLLSDLYAPSERARALGVYSLGIPFGIMTAFFVSAALSGAEATNWRLVFFVLGGPGVLLALVLFFTVKEPVRGRLDTAAAAGTGLSEALRKLVTFPSYWAMALGISFASYAGYAVSAFLVRFILEAYPGLDLRTVLVTLGVLNGTLYAAGTYAGGALADRWAARDGGRGYAKVGVASVAIAMPALMVAVWSQSWPLFLAAVSVHIFFGGFYLGPSFSVAQNLAPPKARAMSTAIFFFVLNIIALGLGPTITGALSDVIGLGREVWWLPFSGALAEAVDGGLGSDLGRRWALTTLSVAYLLAIAAYAFAALRLPHDLARARGEAA
jgi:MFS family permease